MHYNLFVFSHFRKKLDILISLASFFRKFENVLRVAFLIPSTREIPCINKNLIYYSYYTEVFFLLS
jgi:hypothetical protein